MKPKIKSMIWNIKKQKKNNRAEQLEEKRIKNNEDSIGSLWDNFKQCNICITGIPEEEKEQ